MAKTGGVAQLYIVVQLYVSAPRNPGILWMGNKHALLICEYTVGVQPNVSPGSLLKRHGMRDMFQSHKQTCKWTIA